ncbi:hypothetical protein JQ609_01020 [Bradyrhizobium sp. AUGA SZCCT0169]|uniref:hypothetical protein n=1 Tax=Bradyrhizobium sp. AUGA SZCCT0169 TaxID=2807663 RepID=UPI001BA4A8A8|nr:hypothetical protein [Bradyrhizobium sp. AUGA SZCCT0169]MBR1245504.1 hypothetical protein [Bradyrhizobium sp. AUGA SZCCT0169]
MATTDIDGDYRTNNVTVALSKQIVNGPKMRELIARMVTKVGQGLTDGTLAGFPLLQSQYAADPARFMGLVFGAISDFCFNMEYVRRITDARWSYCTKAGDHRVYYPYLGVCPHCVLKGNRPVEAVLGANALVGEEERESRARYFGNKIESHHVGRIGERVIVYILDLLIKSKFPDATSLLVFDDQHDVDAAFFFEGLGIITQIKASPLILLPVMSVMNAPMTEGVSGETGLPLQKRDHTFAGFTSSDHELNLYFSTDDTFLPIGKRSGQDWPYAPLIGALDQASVFKIINNWLTIYMAFEVPKRLRTGDDKKKAWLTSGWGAPIDDNKTKAGLARSDNMMKGTYASLKYGAYYVQECQRRTLKTALVANIDPVHQYADYLEKLEDIRWAHNKDFKPNQNGDETASYTIAKDRLTFLFDSVFTFNRQIMNDPVLADAWDLGGFIKKLIDGSATKTLDSWSGYSAA